MPDDQDNPLSDPLDLHESEDDRVLMQQIREIVPKKDLRRLQGIYNALSAMTQDGRDRFFSALLKGE